MLKNGMAAGMILLIAGVAMAQNEQPAKPAPKPDATPKVTDPAKPATDAQPEKAKLLATGDKAPELQIEKWLKGEPVTGFEKGKVYVVEFWATWCGPCIASMPHLTELQHKYKDKGVTIIGVTAKDNHVPPNTLEKAEKMVKDKGDEGMGYTVAWDKDRKTNDAYMKAAGQGSIPCAFIIDQKGVIAYIGHPAEMNKPLEKIVAGKYDIKAEEAKRKQTREKAEKAEAAFQDAFGAKDWDGAVKAADELLALDADMFAGMIGEKFRIQFMEQKNYDKAYTTAREALDRFAKDNAVALNEIAWTILDTKDVPKAKRDVELALRISERSNELTKNKDGMLLDTLAFAYFQKGDAKKALELQKKAIKCLPDGSPDQMKDEMNGRLKEYEEAVNKK